MERVPETYSLVGIVGSYPLRSDSHVATIDDKSQSPKLSPNLYKYIILRIYKHWCNTFVFYSVESFRIDEDIQYLVPQDESKQNKKHNTED